MTTPRRDSPPDVSELAANLVSPRCGVIRSLKRIYKEASEPELPYIFRADLANHRFLTGKAGKPVVCSGKGFNPSAAQMGALGEAVERYSGACWQPSQLAFRPRPELEGRSLDPAALVLYAPDQYDGLPYAPYSEDAVLGWIQGRSWLHGGPIWIPALAVFLSYEARCHHEFLCPVTSNGLAAGPDVDRALLRAVLEVIERDAFVITWMNRLEPRRRLTWQDHPDRELTELCQSYDRRGVELELYELATDSAAHVIMALGVQTRGSGPAVVVGLGADLSAAAAARGAILEVGQVRPALKVRLNAADVQQRMEALVSSPMQVAELEDHDLLYASPKMLGEFDFMRRVPVSRQAWDQGPSDPARDLAALRRHFAERDQEVVYCDVTPADMSGLGLHTVRAIVPDFQPIHFGASEARLGGARLFDLPRSLGLRPAATLRSELNLVPHPLS